MKILSAEQIRELDKYTIQNEPVASIDLMERAAGKFVEAIADKVKHNDHIHVFCGMGNNGGDGLAVARMLLQRGYLFVNTYIIRHTATGSPDFVVNEERLKALATIQYIETESQVPVIPANSIVIDAIFGSGLSRPVNGIAAKVIELINWAQPTVYSVDVPSGLYCDKPNSDDEVIMKSTVTYTFHAPKLSFMFAANGPNVSAFEVLDIGLDADFVARQESSYSYVNQQLVNTLFRKRQKFSHKGTYGHALIAAGSYGKMGAAVLSVKAALRSGAGLVSVNIPKCGYDTIQISCPEAMAITDKEDTRLSTMPDLKPFSAIGIGPGIGTDMQTAGYLKNLLAAGKPLALDADALNIISSDKGLLSAIPADSILTPHPGEFKRLVGTWADDLDKLQKQINFSSEHKVIIVLKGANTSISNTNGFISFNSTGNAGMAKGGSGDVLTGIITSLLAQGYEPEMAGIIGVYVHGLAGDLAREELGETAVKASDLVYYLPQAFKQLEQAS